MKKDADTAVGNLVVHWDDGQFTQCHRQQQQAVRDSNATCQYPSAMRNHDERPAMK